MKKASRKDSGCIQFVALAIGAALLMGAFITSLTTISQGNKNTEGGRPNWDGSNDTVSTLDGLTLPATEGKVGHEQHASKQNCFQPGNIHYDGPLSFFASTGSVSNCMSFGGNFTRDQERWYFNMRWNYNGRKDKYQHTKVIITNPENGKRIAASIEEYGPAEYLWTRDGINSGAPPEIYNYLELENPYTGNPSDGKGWATYGFAKDQNIPLGPLE